MRMIILVLIWGLSAGVLAAQENARITVSGFGQVEAVPDMALVRVGIIQQADEAAQALALMSEATAAVLARLSAEGIAPRDMQTGQLQLNPQYDHSSTRNQPRLVGFQASTMLNIRVRDLEMLGHILDAVVSDGANMLNGLSFSVAEPEPLMNEARQLAVDDARAKAELLAERANMRLGRVLSINEQGGGRPAPMMQMEMARMSSDVAVAQGEVSLSAQVSIVWEMVAYE